MSQKRKPFRINVPRYAVFLLIILGIAIRLFMIIFYYYANLTPQIQWGGWGDVSLNYDDIDSVFTGEWIWGKRDLAYPPLSIFFLVFLRVMSFGNFLVFAFYSFLLELIVALLFYVVLIKFEIPNRNLVYGIFLVNPFYFLNYVFSASNVGYHITDSFFCLFLVIALIFYPRDNKSLYYLFLGLSMCAKWYTLPAAALIFLKYFMEKDWNEIKKIFTFIGIPIIIFLISPIFYLPNYLDLYYDWFIREEGSTIQGIPLYIKVLPFIVLTLLYLIFRMKKADILEMSFFSIVLMSSVMLFVKLFVRYLTPLIYYGHLKTNKKIFEFNADFKIIKIKIDVGNHLLTFILSVIGCIVAIGIILFVF